MSMNELDEAVTSQKADWPSLLDDAFLKFKNGETDERELIRIFGPEGKRILTDNGYDVPDDE